MKKKRIIYISIVLGVLILGVFGVLYFKSNNNIKKVEELLKNGDYKNVYNIIKEKELLSNDNEEINDLIKKNISEYSISSFDDYIKLSDNDWEKIKSFDEMIDKLNLSRKYTYLSELIKIKNDYDKYIPVITWYDSSDKEAFDNCFPNDNDANSWKEASKCYSSYSFEKYGIENLYISDLEQYRTKSSTATNNLGDALNSKNISKAEKALNELEKLEDKRYKIDIKIIEKYEELENKIKKLPVV